MVDNYIKRAQVLMETNRFSEAKKELKKALSSDPNNVDVLSLLAICSSESEEHDKANELMQRAIGIRPDDPNLLYTYSRILLEQNDVKNALVHIKNAIAIYPYSADFFYILAAIHLYKKEWQDALDNANKGLEIEADHLGCLNVRSTALNKLGKKGEAFDTIKEALNQNPENAYTHANHGWGLLERGEHKKALEHFRESLKLNPNFDLAKAGMVEALKAKYPLYKLFLRYAFWISNMKSQ
ncbi:MAG: tetratricopeptide repeat protein, partial [Bacteroidota bacterium]